MNKILILFAHPRFEKSKTNRALLKNIGRLEGVTLNDLYEQYPDFNIDIEREKELLLVHEIIVWHHPIYMYSAPPMLKQWIDLVLEHGWAHGREGVNLKGKIIFNAVTAGGKKGAYTPGMLNNFTVRQFLVPFEQTATLCKMIYLPPFVVHGTHLLSDADLENYVRSYRMLLERLTKGEFDVKAIKQFEYLNDWLSKEMGL